MPERHSTIAVALRVLAGTYLCALVAGDARAQDTSAPCGEAPGIAVLSSPLTPWKGSPLRVIVTAEEPLQGELSLVAPDGKVAATSPDRHGGPPYFWSAEVTAPLPGKWQATLTRDGSPSGCATITREIVVHRKQQPSPRKAGKGVWPLTASWDRDSENLYSAWIEMLSLIHI